MASTRVVVITTNESFNLPGTSWTQDQITTQFRDAIPSLGSMSCDITDDANGDKVFTFRPRTGTKG